MIIKLILVAGSNDTLKNDPFMPLSLPIIASLAPEHRYIFVDMLSEHKINYNEKVDLVGISYRITAEKTAFKIAEKFREKNVKVVLGGPQASANPFEAVKHCDSVVIGEAEALWHVLLKDLENNKLKNFYVSSPKTFKADKYTTCQIHNYYDLKKYNMMPVRNKYKKKYRFDTVYATRGCPIDCDFCSVTNLYGSKIRTRNIDDVVKEIDTFKNYYYLLDDNVFGRHNNYDYYLELYEKISGLKKKRFWTGQANLGAASDKKGREVIKAAAKAGLIYASIGIESINYEVLRKSGVINKIGADGKKDILTIMKENIKFIQEQGIIISGWFTIGYDEDNLKTFYDTVNFCVETKIIPIISPLEALPGTRLYTRMEKADRIDTNKTINIKHLNLSDEEIINAIKDVNKIGLSLKEDFKRLKYYFNLFEKDNTDMHTKIEYKIHKAIFLIILQLKIKKGLSSFANMESFIKK